MTYHFTAINGCFKAAFQTDCSDSLHALIDCKKYSESAVGILTQWKPHYILFTSKHSSRPGRARQACNERLMRVRILVCNSKSIGATIKISTVLESQDLHQFIDIMIIDLR